MWSPPKSLAWQKGNSAGLLVDFGEAWALTSGLRPAPTCKRDWGATGGHRRDFMVGCPLAAAAVLSCKVRHDRWIAAHLLGLSLIAVGGLVGLLSRFSVLLSGQPLGCLLWIREGGLSRLRFRGFGRSMMSVFSLCLGRMLFF